MFQEGLRETAQLARCTHWWTSRQCHPADGGLVIADGVTRATRVARLLPGSLVTVEVAGDWRAAVGGYPTIGDRNP
ncbi:MAG: hypothetical protein U0800_19275 [Isosphaeraceae bacterium]